MSDTTDLNTAGNVDRRRLLQAGAAGAVVVGAVATGAPSVLGLSSAPGYAAAASTTPTTPPPTNPPTTGQLSVIVYLYDGSTIPPVELFPSGTTGDAYLKLGATTTRTTATTLSGNTIQFGLVAITPGNYTIDLSDITDTSSGGWANGYSIVSWFDGQGTGGTQHANPYAPAVTISAGTISNVYVTLLVAPN